MKAGGPQKPAHGLLPLEDLLGATYARGREGMVAPVIFAGTAIFLAVLSVYGVLSQRVRERAREIGIRMTLGASAFGLVGWVAGAGLRLMAIGLGAGLFAAWVLSGTLDRLLGGVALLLVALATAMAMATGGPDEEKAGIRGRDQLLGNILAESGNACALDEGGECSVVGVSVAPTDVAADH